MATDVRDNFPVVGQITCPHPDGDFTLTVKDMVNWATGFCLIEQTGQGEKHAIMLKADEAGKLADILKNWKPAGVR